MARVVPDADAAPIVGSMPWFLREGLLPYVERSFRELGDAFTMRIGPSQQIVLCHPEMFRHVLKTRRDIYVKGRSYDNFRLLVGDGLVTAEGETWALHRRIAQPAFARSRLETFVGLMGRATDRIIRRWRTRRDPSAPLDIHDEMTRITMEIVSESLFGTDGSSDPREAQAFSEALLFLSERGNSPVPIPRWLPTPGNRRLTRALSALDDAVYRIIHAARASSSKDATTLLKLLLDAKDPESGAAFDEKQLRDEVITMFLAGHETTALALTWGLHTLRRFPDVVTRIREEADAVLTADEATAADVSRLRYTSQVLEEILRLRPAVWAVARDSTEADEMCGYDIPKDSTVMPSISMVHRHPEFWDRPEEFRPERFEPSEVKKRHPFAYVPFSQGPRVCIGNTFSMMEGTLLLAKILRECTFEPADDVAIEMVVAITNRPSAKVLMRPRFRA